MALGEHQSVRSNEAMFLHMSAAAYSVPRVPVACLTVPHLICWPSLECQSFRTSKAANDHVKKCGFIPVVVSPEGPKSPCLTSHGEIHQRQNNWWPPRSLGLASTLLVANPMKILPWGRAVPATKHFDITKSPEAGLWQKEVTHPRISRVRRFHPTFSIGTTQWSSMFRSEPESYW